MIILIDNGHGENTPGKRSPDGRLREYAYTREIARRLHLALTARGHEAYLVTPETHDVSITERVRRVNAYCAKYGAKNVLLVSIHNNAAGMSGWSPAQGWLSIVDDAASAGAKRFADLLFDEVKARGLKARQPVPGRKWYLYRECVGGTKRLGILKNTKCPAVLTENFFQTNRDEVEWMLSEAGKKAIVDIHYDAIIKYMQTS